MIEIRKFVVTAQHEGRQVFATDTKNGWSELFDGSCVLDLDCAVIGYQEACSRGMGSPQMHSISFDLIPDDAVRQHMKEELIRTKMLTAEDLALLRE